MGINGYFPAICRVCLYHVEIALRDVRSFTTGSNSSIVPEELMNGDDVILFLFCLGEV